MTKNADVFDRIAASSPLDSTAAKVTARGTHFEPKFKPGGPAHRKAPPLMRPVLPNMPQLVGVKFGRFTVVGLSAAARKKQAIWVVRCVCGDYEDRTAKAIRNPNNKDDACVVCRKMAYLQKEYKRLGSQPIEKFTGTK